MNTSALNTELKFRDRRADLFGREAVLEDLYERSKIAGLTAIVGRPLSGKTWVLQELGRRLALENPYKALPELGEPVALVGYYESGGDAPDILLRCLSDLYTRWLSSASWNKQLRTLAERHRDDAVGTVGGVVTSILKTVSDLDLPKWSSVAAVVEQGLNGLLAANTERKTGGLVLNRLNYDQARDLVDVLVRINDRRVVLILDSWEKAPQLEMQKDLLDKYLHHPEEWPRTHIFLGIRREKEKDPAQQALSDLQLNPGIGVRELGPIDLDADEQKRLLASVRQGIRAAESLSDRRLVELIGGQPGVLYRWRTGRPTDAGQLETLARDAQYHNYPELRDALETLDADDARIAARIALLPQISAERDWKAVERLIFTAPDIERLANLEFLGILTGDGETPSYGHSTRLEAARIWFTKTERGIRYCRREAELVIQNLHAGIRSAADDTEKYRFVELLGITFQNAGPVKLRAEAAFAGKAAVRINLERSNILGSFLNWLFGDLFSFKSARGTDEKVVIALLLTTESVKDEADPEWKRFVAELGRLAVHIADHWSTEDRDLIQQNMKEFADKITDVVGDWNAFLAESHETDPRSWAQGQLARLRALSERLPQNPELRGVLATTVALTVPRVTDAPSSAERDAFLEQMLVEVKKDTREEFAEALGLAYSFAMDDIVEAGDQAGETPKQILQRLREIYKQHPEHSGFAYAELLRRLIQSPAKSAWRSDLLSELRELASQRQGTSIELIWAEAELFD